MNDKAKLITTGFFWRFLERFGAQGVTFIVSIIIARLLEPEMYGTIALVTIITTILQVFIDAGFSAALIQKKNADDIDFSTVFYFNLIVCCLLYLVLYVLSPFISAFYSNGELTSVIRTLGVIILISGIKSVQVSYVSKHFLFKKFFFATSGGTVAAAIVGIWMAYNGYGVWALVFQNLANQAIDTVILWITVDWRPKSVFSFDRLKILWSFGWKLFLASFINTIWDDLRQLIIGKQYSSKDLAFYNKGQEFPKFATTALNSSVDSILFPALSVEQDNKIVVKKMTRISIRTTAFVLWPMMIGLAVCAKPLITLFLTEKWLPAVPYLQIFCIVYAFQPIHTSNLSAIKAMGRSDYFLILEIIKKVVGLVIILSSMWFGVFWFALSSLLNSVICQIINSWPNRKLLNYNYLDQLKDISSTLILAVFMGIVVFPVSLIPVSSALQLLIQIPLGIIVYLGLSVLFKVESLTYVSNIIKKLVANLFNK